MRSWMVMIGAVVFAWQAQAEPLSAVPDAKPVGTARLSKLVWDVYDATLYAPDGQWSDAQPFALSLHYLMALDGQDIAERSVAEIRKQGFGDEVKLAAWYSQMKAIFPDVRKGSEITGIYQPDAPTAFYLGSESLGQIRDPEFGRWFFNIWLGDNTSEPDIRKQLLGMR